MCIIHIKGITFTRNIKKNCCFKSQHTVKTLWNAITNFSTQARELLRLPSWYKWPLLFVFSSARSQLLGRLTGSSRVQSPRLCRQLLDSFFHCPSSFLNILNMKPERVNTDVLFHCCKVRGHDWMKGTYSEKEKKKKEKQRHVSSFIRGKSNFQCICVVYVCVCVLSPKRAENCKLSLEHQCYKRDTFKKQPWHGCLFPDDSQWHIHFLTNTWTKYLPPLELQRLAALCFLCRAP